MNNKRQRPSWLDRNYSSRRGYALTYWHKLKDYFGYYRSYQNIDWSEVERLVFVCKGNICRSAYAEAVAHKMEVAAVSCGVDTLIGSPADITAASVAKPRGYDLSAHKTQPVMYEILNSKDLIVAMEPWQADFLKENLSRKHQYTLLGLWADPKLPYLHDPYGAVNEYFNKCFSTIDSAGMALCEKMKS